LLEAKDIKNCRAKDRKMKTGIVIGLIALIALIIYKKKSSVNKTTPDSAIGFGYKCMWFTVKTNNKVTVAEILKLENVSDCNWQVGISKAYNDSIFITPTIDGWTLRAE
jgi:hypothetical protein